MGGGGPAPLGAYEEEMAGVREETEVERLLADEHGNVRSDAALALRRVPPRALAQWPRWRSAGPVGHRHATRLAARRRR